MKNLAFVVAICVLLTACGAEPSDEPEIELDFATLEGNDTVTEVYFNGKEGATVTFENLDGNNIINDKDGKTRRDVGGYFHPKDNDTQNQITNNAEMFYISANNVNDNINYAYSTLIHEFQHMINYNMKTIKTV